MAISNWNTGGEDVMLLATLGGALILYSFMLWAYQNNHLEEAMSIVFWMLVPSFLLVFIVRIIGAMRGGGG